MERATRAGSPSRAALTAARLQFSIEDRNKAARGISRHDHTIRQHSQAGDSRVVPRAGARASRERQMTCGAGPVIRQRSGHRLRGSTGVQRNRSGSLSGVGPGSSRRMIAPRPADRRRWPARRGAARRASAPASTSAFPTIPTCSRSWSSNSRALLFDKKVPDPDHE